MPLLVTRETIANGLKKRVKERMVGYAVATAIVEHFKRKGLTVARKEKDRSILICHINGGWETLTIQRV